MRFLSFLFVAVLFLTISTYAQSQEKKGCAKEKECVVKTCDEGTETKAHIKGEEQSKPAVTEQTKKEQTAGSKAVNKKEIKKK
jgi:hypothetical protein